MTNKLYVGGLSYQTTQSDLLRLFGEAGSVATASVITDRESGRSKGFGFVEMATVADAKNAMNQFNGQQFDGRTLVVNEARERGPRN